MDYLALAKMVAELAGIMLRNHAVNQEDKDRLTAIVARLDTLLDKEQRLADGL
jgi:hypothetical protein